MSRTEELIRLSQAGDEQAREAILLENSGLIWSVTKRYFGRGAESEDLFQLGCLGFMKAVDGFRTDYGTQFSTYAVPKISGEIRRFLRDDGAVKVSRSIKERAVQIRNVQNQLLQQTGRDPTVSDLAEAIGLSEEEIAIAVSATASVESIHQDNGTDGFTMESVLTDTDSDDVMLEKIALRQAIDKLPERESLVIQLRYFHGLTQEKVSKILNVTQVQVSRIEKKAIAKLKEYLR